MRERRFVRRDADVVAWQDVTIELFRDHSGVWRSYSPGQTPGSWEQSSRVKETASTQVSGWSVLLQARRRLAAICKTIGIRLVKRFFDGWKTGWPRTSQQPV